jgi:hypothetical protein
MGCERERQEKREFERFLAEEREREERPKREERERLAKELGRNAAALLKAQRKHLLEETDPQLFISLSLKELD